MVQSLHGDIAWPPWHILQGCKCRSMRKQHVAAKGSRTPLRPNAPVRCESTLRGPGGFRCGCGRYCSLEVSLRRDATSPGGSRSELRRSPSRRSTTDFSTADEDMLGVRKRLQAVLSMRLGLCSPRQGAIDHVPAAAAFVAPTALVDTHRSPQ